MKVTLTKQACEQLAALAQRAHDGTVTVREVQGTDGLEWIEVVVLLTDMGDTPPMHVFAMTPTGNLRGDAT
jgi:hypothetical protein